MSKNTYTVIDPVNNNEVLFNGNSGAICYYHILNEFTKDENLGRRANIVQNFGTDNEKLIAEFISAKANSGVNYLYIYEKYLKKQQRHEEALAKRKAYEEARDARKAARLAAKEAMLKAKEVKQVEETAKIETPVVKTSEQVIEEPVVETKAATKSTSKKSAKAKK